MLLRRVAKLVIPFVIIAIISCEKENTPLSTVPVLRLAEAIVLPHPELPRDSIIVISLNYEDADGDIGYREADTLSNNDLIINFLYIDNGEEKSFILPLTTDTLNFNQRLPYLTPSGKNKEISGTITTRIPINPYPGFRPDSVIFICKLYDRALQVSNEVRTPIITIVH